MSGVWRGSPLGRTAQVAKELYDVHAEVVVTPVPHEEVARRTFRANRDCAITCGDEGELLKLRLSNYVANAARASRDCTFDSLLGGAHLQTRWSQDLW